MSEFYHIVPWYDSEEWHRVYEGITSDEHSSKEDALNHLLVWKARCPSLPSGIESTLSLLQVYVEDSKNSNDVANDQLLRLAYSSAIMRFVNHMLDTETVKGTSLYQAAKTLGVPDWIVDLRHDTAHSNTLPAISLLREACSISLKWLQTNYWDNHKLYIQDYVCGQNNVNATDTLKIQALINFCISLGICTNSKVKIRNLSEIPNMAMRESIVNDAKELLGEHIDLSNLKTVSIASLINIMNTHGKKLLKFKDANAVVNEALLGDDGLFLSKELLFFFSANDFKFKNKLNTGYVQCFEVLLTFLHTNDLLLNFILDLIKLTQRQDCGHFKSRLAAMWLAEILAALKISQNVIEKTKTMVDDKVPKRKDLMQLYEHWYPGSNIKNVLVLDLQKPVPGELQDIRYIQPILAHYNNYLTYFVANALDLLVPKLNVEVRKRVCILAKLIASPHQFPSPPSRTIYTADDVLMDDEDVVEYYDYDEQFTILKPKVKEPPAKFVNFIWNLATDKHDWSACPIGKVPWQPIDVGTQTSN
uniref:Las1-like protein n=1 Tax=Heliothis virescens TaxID=7102 RepID=A0A2A4JBY4_HELVI